MQRFGLFLLALLFPTASWGVQDVVNTVHNLSTSGPGAFKSLTVNQVCVFCHTPHGETADAPLWNHQMSGQTYQLYGSGGSTTLNATPGQPTGKSRLCLACHDGTVALGALVNPPTGVTMDLGATLLTGRANLTTDLANDHPISFVYDNTLAIADGELANPATISLPLDNGELQCTSCHDPHEATNKPFLHMSSLNAAICTTCHLRGQGFAWDWASSSHATSTALPGAADPWAERKVEWRGANVAENACFNCHTPHTAVTPKALVKGSEENTCYLCHNGIVASDIQTDFLKANNHPVDTTPNADHDAAMTEDPLTMPLHAECADCHNPHAVQADDPMISFNPASPASPHATPPLANARIKGVSGVDINGSVVSDITNQYELCFKCHGLSGKGPCGGAPTERCSTLGSTGYDNIRVDAVYNIREKVNPGAPGLVSYHPLVANDASNNAEVPSLRSDIPMNRTTSLMYCTDCHNSDTSLAAGAAGPTGPHGSIYEGLFAQNYLLNPIGGGTPGDQYALCFRCHDEAALITDELSGFSHGRHINSRSKSCINCHDPHGSHRFQHLLNFLTFSNYPGGPYEILPMTFAEATWVDNGLYSGDCYMRCHGTGHNPRGY